MYSPMFSNKNYLSEQMVVLVKKYTDQRQLWWEVSIEIDQSFYYTVVY